MVTYKGFNAYYCDPTTLEKLQFIRRFEFCVCSCTSKIPTDFNRKTVSEAQTVLSNCGVDYRVISGLGIIDNSLSDYSNMLATMQSVAPLTVANLINETGVACKILLDANDGFYAVSSERVASGNNYFGSGSAANYFLYMPGNNSHIGACKLTGFGQSNMTFIAIPGYDGNYPASGWITVTTIESVGNDLLFFDSRQESLSNQNVANWFNSITPLPPEVTDPYAEGGNSETGGGTGDFDDTSDPIDFPSLPTIGAVDSGFITIFNPTLAEVKSLATYMWNNPLFDLTTWKKIFADPMDAIIGLSLVPVSIPDAGTRAIKVGNIATDVTMNVAAAQFIEIQCGTINVNEYWGAYLDYSPYTKVEIYLPYCGAHQLSIDDVMNKSVEVRYHVDILSGACCAYVKCGDSVLYTFLGQCSSSIPIAANDFTQVINGVLSAAVSIGSMVATGGMSAPLAVPALASTAANSMKENVEKSGAISGTGGILAIQKPYLILTRPRQAVPENQNAYTGYPSFITSSLGDLSGYTEIEEIHLHDIPATGVEIAEINELLRMGVIL